MRQTLKRFGMYLLVLAVTVNIFNAWPPLPPAGTSGARLGYYAVVWFSLGMSMFFWALMFEFMYRCIKWTMRRLSKSQGQ